VKTTLVNIVFNDISLYRSRGQAPVSLQNCGAVEILLYCILWIQNHRYTGTVSVIISHQK